MEKIIKIKLRQRTKGYLSIVAAFFIQMSFSTFFIWGTICLYITSYMHHHVDPSIQNKLTIVIVLLSQLGLQIGMPLGLNTANYLGLRNSTLIVGVSLAFVIYLSSLVKSFWIFMILNGLGFGVLMGLNYTPPAFNCYFYFPDKRPLISGLVFSGLPLGTLITNYVALGTINPTNVSPRMFDGEEKLFPEEIAKNVPSGMRWLALTILLHSLIAWFLMFPYKQGRKKIKATNDGESVSSYSSMHTVVLQDPLDHPSSGLTQPILPAGDDDGEYEEEEEENVKDVGKMANMLKEIKYPNMEDVLKSENFKLLLLMGFFGSAFSYLIVMNYKNYGIEKIEDDSYLTFIGSVSQIFNGAARISFGLLAVKVDLVKTLTIIIYAQVFFSATFVFIAHYKFLYLVWVIVILVVLAAHLTILPALSVEVFGMKTGRNAFSYLFMGLTVANCMQFFWCYFMLSVLSFDFLIGIYVIFCIVGAFVGKKFYEVITIENKDILQRTKMTGPIEMDVWYGNKK